MGPRSCERGRIAYSIELAMSRSLQWGRVRVNAEGSRCFGGWCGIGWLQWGRVRVNAEGNRISAARRGLRSFNGAAFV